MSFHHSAILVGKGLDIVYNIVYNIIRERDTKPLHRTKGFTAMAMNVEEQARQDVRSHKYHNLIPGQKSPQEFNNSMKFWNDIYSDYPEIARTGLNMRLYREAWVAEYQKEYDAYFSNGD
jgi:hypothetical protein